MRASTAHTLSRSSPIVFSSVHTPSSSKSDNFSDPTRRRNTRAAAAPVFLTFPPPGELGADGSSWTPCAGTPVVEVIEVVRLSARRRAWVQCVSRFRPHPSSFILSTTAPRITKSDYEPTAGPPFIWSTLRKEADFKSARGRAAANISSAARPVAASAKEEGSGMIPNSNTVPLPPLPL